MFIESFCCYFPHRKGSVNTLARFAFVYCVRNDGRFFDWDRLRETQKKLILLEERYTCVLFRAILMWKWGDKSIIKHFFDQIELNWNMLLLLCIIFYLSWFMLLPAICQWVKSIIESKFLKFVITFCWRVI